jgi:L-arabinose isomerase
MSSLTVNPLRVGLFGIGLNTYWPQFAGLRERLTGYVDQVAGKLQRPGAEIVNLGLIDTPEKRKRPGIDFARPTWM